METENNHPNPLFSSLIGEQLSSVCFVQDYLQIEFDGRKLTTYTNPVILLSDSTVVVFNQFNYKNELCSFISKVVNKVRYVEDEFVEIFFDNCAKAIKIILDKNSDNIYYSDHEEKWFVI